jgi:predicted AlkP superfamily phosphohydrolase/phosphomutase
MSRPSTGDRTLHRLRCRRRRPSPFFPNKPLRPGAMFDIIDIAPTVLKYFAMPIPSDIDGKPLF